MDTLQQDGVLKGVRVLDFTIALAGPFTAWQLADLGAEVWKIERYGAGDQARSWDPFVNEMSTLYTSYNKNKQSIEIDLSQPEGKKIIYQMVLEADVVLENFKSGSIDRLGLGYDKLKEINPKLIFVSTSGFGASGPLMKYPCYDAIAEARGGLAASSGEPKGAPVKVGNCICDTLSGLYGFNAVLMALIDRERTGQGCKIDLSMTDVAMQSCEETIMDYGLTGNGQTRFGDHDRFTAPYGMFEARDGYVVLIADTQTRWDALCKALGLQALQNDARFVDNAARITHREALVQAITEVTRRLHRQTLEEKLLAVDVPASSVLTFIEAYTSDHANNAKLTSVVQQDKIGAMRFYNNPLRFNNEPCEIKSGAPLLGGHTRSILRQAGYSEVEIQSLYDSEVVGSSLC